MQKKTFSHSSFWTYRDKWPVTSHCDNCPRDSGELSWSDSSIKRESVWLLCAAISHSPSMAGVITSLFTGNLLCFVRTSRARKGAGFEWSILIVGMRFKLFNELSQMWLRVRKETNEGPPCCVLNWVFCCAFFFLFRRATLTSGFVKPYSKIQWDVVIRMQHSFYYMAAK